MVGIFGSSIYPDTYPQMESAKEGAIDEAANIGGLFMQVLSVRAKTDSILFIGTVPKLQFLSRLSKPTPADPAFMEVEVDGLGKFHTTWGSISRSGSGVLGYLNMAGFARGKVVLEVTEDEIDEDDDETLRIAVVTPRVTSSELREEIGNRLCHRCAREIGEGRLRILPDTSLCLPCAKILERRI